MLALNYMHKQNMSHRDLKLDNIMCHNELDGDLDVKITDFGFACLFSPSDKMDLSLGTPMYMAPELVNDKEYDQRVDVWALGCIVYILLTGSPPFSGVTTDEMSESILNKNPDFG